MEEDWDLHAVVRGCSATSTTAPAASTSQLFSTLGPDGSFQNLIESRRDKFIPANPFFPATQTVTSLQTLPISPLSVLGGLQELLAEQQQSRVNLPPPPPKQLSLSTVGASKTKSGASHCSNSRLKRRKNYSRRVYHVPVEGLSSDRWSWRKYGQKPIKGSPYPRGYYRCSALKGCMARKQVERNRSDPGMFILTYTGEHSHPTTANRNSLAGGVVGQNQQHVNPGEPKFSPALSAEVILSRAEELVEAQGEDDDLRVSDMALEDDFFTGLEDLLRPAMADCSSDQFPRLANSATTTAAGGG